MLLTVGQNITIAALGMLTLARAWTAVKKRDARPSWLASLSAACGLLTLGTFVSQEKLDRLLGGSNLIFLFQAVFAVAAFWLFDRAVRVLVGITIKRSDFGWLVLAEVCIIVPFILTPDRAPFTTTFVNEYLPSPTLWLSLNAYMVSLIVIALRSFRILRSQRRRLYVLYAVGIMLVVFACCCDLFYASIGAFGGPTLFGARDGFYFAFEVFFYPGILVMVVAFGGLTLERNDFRWLVHAFRLDRILNGLWGELEGRPDITKREDRALPDLVSLAPKPSNPQRAVAYCLHAVVEVRNLEVEHNVTIAPHQLAQVERVEARLTNYRSRLLAVSPELS